MTVLESKPFSSVLRALYRPWDEDHMFLSLCDWANFLVRKPFLQLAEVTLATPLA